MTDSTAAPGPTGLWLVGARGAISTCVAYGVAGLRNGLVSPVGLPTEYPPLNGLPLVPLEDLVLGGHDVCTRDLSSSAGELIRAGILSQELVAATTAEATAFEAAIRPGVLDAADTGFADLDARAADLGSKPPREQIAQLVGDLDGFMADHGLARTVVVHVASTEAEFAPQAAWDSLEALEAALDAGVDQPASIIYAYAAISSGRPFVNFTPSIGAGIPALLELAQQAGVPVAGNDGKTGETLLKSALAPMFKARALNVLAWQGYNMLGNRDGEVLKDPAHKAKKLKTKDEALRSILDGSSPDLSTQVGIDYVPSLGDWKTAMDFVHFEGFLGAKMSLQFTWSGCDSALAAPLIIDLARLADLASRRGEAGALEHLAGYFKAPLGDAVDHDFHRQMELLHRYANDIEQR
ncbi:inositol-3-phosphate synthase [Planctomycetota bacterium]|nr:inositol-3-phosphate synthase [Planctomycetota bacterium]